MRAQSASFKDSARPLTHARIIDNEDWIVNWVIPGKAADYVRRKSEEYTSMEMVIDHLDEVEKRTRSYLRNIGECELGRGVKFTVSSGDAFNLSVEESLFQSFTEQLFHIGELIALLWQIDIEPPRMQWLWNNPDNPNSKEHRTRTDTAITHRQDMRIIVRANGAITDRACTLCSYVTHSNTFKLNTTTYDENGEKGACLDWSPDINT